MQLAYFVSRRLDFAFVPSTQGKFGRIRDGAPQWHADLGILSSVRKEDMKRTRSDAMSSGNPPQQGRKEKAKGEGIRARSQSGDSITYSKMYKVKVSPEPERGDREDGVGEEGGVPYAQTNGHTDGVTHRNLKGARSSSIRRSRSFDDVLSTARVSPERPISPEEADFCMLSYTEPEDMEAGGGYTMIFDECESLSDEEGEDQSTEVKDLTPMDPSQSAGEGTDSYRLASCSVTPPRATTVLINAFLQRMECVMVNGVHYPPGLFFVQ